MTIIANTETVAVPQQNMITVTLYEASVAICEEPGESRSGTQVIMLNSRQSVEALIRSLQQCVEQWGAA